MSLPQTQRVLGFGLATWLGMAFLYAPIFAVIVFSFNESRLITVWEGFSLEWYARALKNADLHRAAFNSLVVATGAAVFSTLLALSVAVALHGRQVRRTEKNSTYALMALPLLLPEIVIAVASLSFFALIGLRLGLGNVLIAHVVFCTPFAYAPIRARISTIPPALSQAAADLYATPWQVFRHVTLPLLSPGILSGATLAFIISLDDFIITQMVAPPGAMTLPVYIYSMVRRGITPEINAVSSLLLAVSIALVVVSYLFNQRKAS